MRHAGLLEYTERKAHFHRKVLQGSLAEEKALRRGGIKGEHGEGL